MATWHATLTYTLAGEAPDTAKLTGVLRAHGGTAHVDGRSLTIDLFMRSGNVTSLQAAARFAAYVARRAIFAAGLSVAAENGLSVVLAPALEGAGTVAHTETV